jgi:hypothetical protein
MAKTLKGGTRVRFEDDERLDIPDALALQELNYDYINEISAAMLGGSKADNAPLPVGGTMSYLMFNTSNPAATTIRGPQNQANSKALFLYSYQSQQGYNEVQALVYDPSLSGQQTTINLSSYSSPATVYVWARRIDIFSEVDTRKKWNVISGTEETFSLATRESYRIEFATTSSTSPPGTDPNWFCIAVGRLSGTTWSWRRVHPFDCGRVPGANAFSDFTTAHTPHGAIFELTPFRQVGKAQIDLYQWTTIALNKSVQDTTNANLQNQITAAQNAANVAQNAADEADAKAVALQPLNTKITKVATRSFRWIAILTYNSVLENWSLSFTNSEFASVFSPNEVTFAANNKWNFSLKTTGTARVSTAVVDVLTPFDVAAQPYLCFTQTSNTLSETNVVVYLQTVQNLATGGIVATPPTGSPANKTTITVCGVGQQPTEGLSG